VIAVLTGHALKDPDYMIRYHEGKLASPAAAGDASGAPKPIAGAFQNAPQRVAATKAAILASLERQR